MKIKNLMAIVTLSFSLLVLAWPQSVLAAPIYIDVSSGVPELSYSGYYYPSPPSVTQTSPNAWAINIGVVGAYRGTTTPNRGLELTDSVGNILDSFGVLGFAYNNYYSWTTIYTELFTIDASGQSGRTSRVNNAQVNSVPIEPGTYQLAMPGITTDLGVTYEIYLMGLNAPETPNNPVPEPSTMLVLGCGLVGLAGFRKRFKRN